MNSSAFIYLQASLFNHHFWKFLFLPAVELKVDSTLKMLITFFLTCHLSSEKSDVIIIFIPLYVYDFVPLATFKI